MKNIFLLGSLNMDMVFSCPYIPRAGETLTSSSFFTNCGGKGANQAVACSRLGGKVRMLGAVGGDTYGVQLLEGLKKSDVDISCVKTVDNVNSGIAVIIVVENDNRIILDKGANAKITTSDVDNFLKDAKEGDLFLTQSENDLEIIGYALRAAHRKGMYTMLNPAPADKKVLNYINYVDMILPNRSELELLTGESRVEKACAKLGVPEIVVTLGGDGYYYLGKEKIKGSCPKVKVVDTTAAGDTFCGALAVKLSRNECIAQALQFATKCASLSCTRRGAQQSIPTLDEAEKF